MATSIALPASGRPSVKPTRSMTYPLREPKTQGEKRRVKQGEPFDPEDLSRRLKAHLVEQKARAELRRKAREAKAAADARLYHHVPTVAASAFERTMTPDAMRSIPKIAQPAIKAHLKAIEVDEPGSSHVTNLKKTQAKDKERLERQLLSSRNQFQWNQDLEDANEADIERDLFKLPQRTFTEFAYLKGKTPKTAPRPMSTGDVLWEEDQIIASPKPRTKPVHDRNDRNDWAQRDDDSRKEKPGPLLRKKDSNWILLGMKSMKHDRGIENVDISPPDSRNSTKMRGRFLARFKRHPS